MLFRSSPYAYLTEAQRTEIGSRLSILVNQHYRFCRPIFGELERDGVFLGNGYFFIAVLRQDAVPVLQSGAMKSFAGDLEAVCKKHLRTPLYYAISANGSLHMILCYPRAGETDAERREIPQQLYTDFLHIQRQLERDYPGLRVLISDIFRGESQIYLAANSVHHAIEYFDFRTAKPKVIQLDAEMQLHGAFVEDFDVYRKLSNQAVETLVQASCNEEALATSIADQIMENCSISMESVHHHIQMFALTFTERLGSSGFVDSEYIQSHQIIRRYMSFETEGEFRTAVLEIIGDLRRQYLTLSTIGKQHQIQAVRNHVLENISDCNLSVNTLALQFHITSSQLTKQFKRYYGLTLHQFIQETRLQKARELIQAHPDWSLHAIGAAAGYVDISTMYRAFKKRDGITPGAVKQKNRQSP